MDPFAPREPNEDEEPPRDDGESTQDTADTQALLAEQPRYTGLEDEEGSDGMSFTALLAQANLEWAKSGTLDPDDEDLEYALEHVEHAIKKLVLVPEVVERLRRPYAILFNRLYTMIPTGSPKRYFAGCRLYPINCSGAWASHTIEFLVHKEQKFVTI